MSQTIPASLNVRLRDDERAAIATLQAAITIPHRRPATITDAVRAALMIAAASLAGQGAAAGA